ncbi:MAG: hypothetical protein HZB56_09440 [Deltaproteobacteria bacterium]|nr:hypothetical protein [Deltaproteobacteria bacterium]
MTRTTHVPLAALLAMALALPGAAAAYEKTFSQGSLIIPTQAEYQTDCGTISAYGLMYMLLLRNEVRAAATPAKPPITIYWIIEPRKLSHHRCNTGRMSGTTFVPNSGRPDYTGFNENDGCDFVVEATDGRPVGLLQNDGSVRNDFKVTTTTYSTATGQVTRDNIGCLANSPTGTCATIGHTATSDTNLVKYSGGLWVIDAADRPAVLEELNLALANATNPMWKFRDNGTCTTIPVPLTTASHHVNIHVANSSFRAPVARMMNDKPARIALMGARYVWILENYLENAGLAGLANAAGTPLAHGVIYDVLDPLTDFLSTGTYPYGAINMTETVGTETKKVYQVMWAPHWEEDSDVVATPSGYTATTYRQQAFQNIARFADDGYGVFLECASIASHEGSFAVGSNVCSGTDRTCRCNDDTQCTINSTMAPTCTAGTTCGTFCLACPAGTVMSTPCDRARCIPIGSECPAGSTYRANDFTCWACTDATRPRIDSPLPATGTPQCRRNDGTSPRNATARTPNGSLATAGTSACTSPGYALSCVTTVTPELTGWDPVRFQTNARIVKNGITGDAQYGGNHEIPDCTDREVPGGQKYANSFSASALCMNYHPTEGGPGNMFSQKGNSRYRGDMGHTSYWKPAAAAGSAYGGSTFHFATSRSGTAQDDGWDFVTARHKDGDPTKGMVVYLGGHDLSNDPAGNRVVLNTMLNLGFSDAGPELSRSEPVGYVSWSGTADNLTKTETVFQGTYVQRPPPGPYQDWINYNPSAPHSWRFPYINGHLRAYPLSSVSTTLQSFADNATWDAASRIPAPGNRTIFSVMNGSGNSGWKRINFRYTETDPATCTAFYMAGSNKVCSLSAKLAEGNTAGVTLSTLEAGSPNATRLGTFVQQVRGFCAPRVAGAFEPSSDADCANTGTIWQRNTPLLGGVDHSSPAIVGQSPYPVVSGSTSVVYSHRPTVAYFGARDGMLHAVFVSGTLPWVGNTRTLAAGTAAGTELWAFVPPGQIRSLSTNNAMVDANVSVMDVFGDFPRDANNDGVFDLSSDAEKPSGQREWRTILVSTAGEGASEIFALDVTDPLRPVLLWRVSGPDNRTSSFTASNQATYALRWANTATTNYDYTPATAPDGIKTGLYDYKNLGYAFGTAMGTLWSGNAFRWVVYAATNSADWTDAVAPTGYRGIEVFAIDVITGKKLWQWQNRYTIRNDAGTVIADNLTIPGRPALVDVNGDGSVDRLYVGDLEGHLWELSAETGRNLNYLDTALPGKRSFPLYATPAMTTSGVTTAVQDEYRPQGQSALARQPLTSPVGIGRFSVVPTALEPYLKERIAVAEGTMGVDWSISPTQRGHVYVMPVFPEGGSGAVSLLGGSQANTRLTAPLSVSDAAAAVDGGLLLSAAVWDTQLSVGERVYGMPKILNNQMFVNTSYGTFTGDLTSSINDAGRTVRVDTNSGAARVTDLDTGQKRFGGVLIFGTEIVVTSDKGMTRLHNQVDSSVTGARVRSRTSPTSPKSWEQRLDGNPPFVQ